LFPDRSWQDSYSIFPFRKKNNISPQEKQVPWAVLFRHAPAVTPEKDKTARQWGSNSCFLLKNMNSV